MSNSSPRCEVSWFSALCDDGHEFLGQPGPLLQSDWEHCRNIALLRLPETNAA